MRPGMHSAYISRVRRCMGALAAGAVLLAGCGGSDSSSAPNGHIAVRSPVFADGQPIPVAYTCSGKNISPPLSWSDVPKGAKSLKLVMKDLTKSFTHWKVTGIDASATSVAADAVPAGGTQGKNSFGKAGYGGPCPPSGDPAHRYAFTISAIGSGGKVLDKGSLVGTFKK
jgi:Raf kinase inhibitor-like YbhB/YbcL family protein